MADETNTTVPTTPSEVVNTTTQQIPVVQTTTVPQPVDPEPEKAVESQVPVEEGSKEVVDQDDYKYIDLLRLLPSLTNTIYGQEERNEVSAIAMKIVRHLTSDL